MTEENKAIARRVYEIVSTGDFGRAKEIVDQDAPDNELLPNDPPVKLIDTFKETFHALGWLGRSNVERTGWSTDC